jgi:predicted nucleotidyltransferase
MVETQAFRQQLLSFAIEFIQAIMNLNGVTRIAMLGSLTTNKPDPKDADLLISVKNNLDLSRLAKAGRRLQGRAQSLNRGGEVFLANPDNQYIGRICPWKECGPGIRSSCDALHCGRRLYLHDDFGSIQLADELVKNPPIEIWPNYKARVEVPKDLADALTKVLG